MSLILDGVGLTRNGIQALKDINFEAAVGGIHTLLGPISSGKTTLLRVIAGLERPTVGRILLAGHDITDVPVRKRRIAMVYEEFVNYPNYSVYDNIAAPLRVGAMRAPDIDRKVREMAEALRLSAFLARRPSELSGGQQQRTAIARALVKDAAIVLLDGPLVNLDYKLREELRDELKLILTRRNTIVIYASMEALEAMTLAGSVSVMHDGAVLQSGPVLDVYHSPQSVGVARLMSDPPLNLLSGQVRGGHITLANMCTFSRPAHFSDLPDGDYQIGIRPEHFAMANPEARGSSLLMQVRLAEVTGSQTYVHLGLVGSSAPLEDLVWLREGIHRPRLGSELQLSVYEAQLLVFSNAGALLRVPLLQS